MHIQDSKQTGMTNYKLIATSTTKADRSSKHRCQIIASKAGLILSK